MLPSPTVTVDWTDRSAAWLIRGLVLRAGRLTTYVDCEIFNSRSPASAVDS